MKVLTADNPTELQEKLNAVGWENVLALCAGVNYYTIICKEGDTTCKTTTRRRKASPNS